MNESKEPAGADDPYDLNRFVRAQVRDYDRALAEITAGRKVLHWMWYIFPQFAGLGFSETSRRYSIKSADEARAYLAHPVLGRGSWPAPRRHWPFSGSPRWKSSAPRTT
jgi:uncharacterized protein (DUF1810 family)